MASTEHYHGHRQRQKEKFDENPTALADYEILELLLGYVIVRKDVKPIAKAILRKYGSISNIFGNKLTEIEGVGEQTELFLNIISEFFARIQTRKVKKLSSIAGPKDIYNYMRYIIAYAPHEKVAAIFLNSKNAIMGHQIIAEGVVNSTSLYPRSVVELAVKNNAAGIILSHNHPSGDSTPTPADIEMTKVVEQALEVLSIKLVDHVVVCANEFSSMKDLRLF